MALFEAERILREGREGASPEWIDAAEEAMAEACRRYIRSLGASDAAPSGDGADIVDTRPV